MSEEPSREPADPGLALCLSSSFFGYYAHLGLLSAMEARGLRPGRIAGASAGALAGGLWAAGLRGEELARIIYDFHFLRAFFDLGAFLRLPGIVTGIAGAGLLSGVRMRRYLSRCLGERRIEDLKSPRLEIAVSNLTRQCPEVRDSGPLSEFMIASCAMPVLFKPQRIGGEDFLDGGVANESPFDHWLDDPTVHTIVVHRIRHTSEMGGLPWRTPGGILGACHGVAANELHRRRCQQAEASGKRLVFLETGHECPGLLHRGKARGYFAAGEKTGREWSGLD
jgi:NTE family protein